MSKEKVKSLFFYQPVPIRRNHALVRPVVYSTRSFVSHLPRSETCWLSTHLWPLTLHSVLKHFTGLAFAAFTVWRLIKIPV